MPFKSKKLGWGGQVKKIVKGAEFSRLLDFPGWKETGENTYQYRKLKRGFKTKTEAVAWEADHWKEIQETQINPPEQPTRLTFSQASTPYLQQVKTRSKSHNTVRYKTAMVRNLISFWGQDLDMPIQTLELESYLDNIYDTQGGKKANREIRELNTLFRWMLNRKVIDDNPMTPIEQYAEDAFEKYVPPREDILAVIDIANAFEKDLIRTFYHSLARSVEIRRLKVSDCDFVNRKVWLSTRKRKGGSLDKMNLDMNNSLFEILKRRCALSESEYVFPGQAGDQLPKTTLDKILPRLFKKLPGIKPFGFHSIRHHVAAHLFLNCRYSVADLQKILRHKRASTTDTYLRSIINMEMDKGLDALDDFENNKADHMTPDPLLKYPDFI